MNTTQHQGLVHGISAQQMNTFEAGPDGLIFPLIFVAVIISKIVQAAREAKQQAPGAGPEPQTPGRPAGNEQADELRAFLERLGAPVPPAEPPPPPPLKPRQRVAPPVAKTATRPAQEPRSAIATHAASGRRGSISEHQQVHSHVHCGTRIKDKEERAAKSRRDLIGHLDDASSLRRAVLHREILGPPLAMGDERR